MSLTHDALKAPPPSQANRALAGAMSENRRLRAQIEQDQRALSDCRQSLSLALDQQQQLMHWWRQEMAVRARLERELSLLRAALGESPAEVAAAVNGACADGTPVPF